MKSILIVRATPLADHVMEKLGIPGNSDEHPRGLRVDIIPLDEDREKARRFATKNTHRSKLSVEL
ncbi:MAG: hypothetical protein Q8O19_02100 [Rectinemataceae bacterium]|nr:hypothetical protein [Rectinemataceae bacterium]